MGKDFAKTWCELTGQPYHNDPPHVYRGLTTLEKREVVRGMRERYDAGGRIERNPVFK